jgi:hypothetical protein
MIVNDEHIVLIRQKLCVRSLKVSVAQSNFSQFDISVSEPVRRLELLCCVVSYSVVRVKGTEASLRRA